ncbi:MAG: hypothetical protein ABIP48_27240 [Planctomycetota bacterium]
MNSCLWQLDRHNAQLRVAQLTAAIDLSNPAVGLSGLCLSGNSLGDARVLGIEMPSFPVGRADALAESLVRGADLVADYEESENWPVRVEAVWRAGDRSTSSGALAIIELVISVRTHRLESRPELVVQSALPTTDVLRLADQDTAQFDSIGREGPCVIKPAGGPGCLLFRFPASESSPSYAEMVHPADFVEDRLRVVGESAPSVELRHRLFPGPLEKGVILRARVCAVFCRRDDDAQTAAQCYAAFSAAEPPLGG